MADVDFVATRSHADSPSMMAHVGDGVYKCRKCLGIF